jgi:hypothetical protein
MVIGREFYAFRLNISIFSDISPKISEEYPFRSEFKEIGLQFAKKLKIITVIQII